MDVSNISYQRVEAPQVSSHACKYMCSRATQAALFSLSESISHLETILTTTRLLHANLPHAARPGQRPLRREEKRKERLALPGSGKTAAGPQGHRAGPGLPPAACHQLWRRLGNRAKAIATPETTLGEQLGAGWNRSGAAGQVPPALQCPGLPPEATPTRRPRPFSSAAAGAAEGGA